MPKQLIPAIKETAIVVILFVSVFAIFFGSRYLRLYSPDALQIDSMQTLYLEERKDLDGLIEKLDELDIEYDVEELRWASSIFGWRLFHSGKYDLSSDFSYSDFLSKLARGLQDHVSVTVPPGIDVERFSRVLSNQLAADSVEFSNVFSDSSDLAIELELDSNLLFGKMLPDTYNMYWTTPAERVVRRIYREFERGVVQRFADQIDNHPLNLEEIITLASIVEWEARIRDEKRRISGLYQNRLNRNMLLQADPTVIYALGERRRLLYEDYTIDHPFNTYIHRGLPPGPITNPDLESIRAVLNPEEHEYLFMVAHPSGSHVFSRTYEEHLSASAEWRQWIREQYRIKREREREELNE